MVQLVKKTPANAGYARDEGLIPESGRSPGGGNGNVLQHSCLENSMDRGAWGLRVGHYLDMEYMGCKELYMTK